MKEDYGRNDFFLPTVSGTYYWLSFLAVVVEVLLYVDSHFEKGCLVAKN